MHYSGLENGIMNQRNYSYLFVASLLGFVGAVLIS